MPMEREKHEEILNKLNNPELAHEDRVEYLGLLRNDYSGIHSEFETLQESNSKLESDNKSLVIANGKMFREQGYDKPPEDKEPEQPKSLNELLKYAETKY